VTLILPWACPASSWGCVRTPRCVPLCLAFCPFPFTVAVGQPRAGMGSWGPGEAVTLLLRRVFTSAENKHTRKNVGFFS